MLQLPNSSIVLCLILHLIAFFNLNSHVSATTNDIQLPTVLEPNAINGFKVTGETLGISFGRELSNAGDVNGDQIDDLIILSPSDGKVHIMYGNIGSQPDFNTSSDYAGFTIHVDLLPAASPFMTVAGAGDFNNDGLNDIVIGIPSYGDSAEGVVFVIYGKDTRPIKTINLSTLSATDGIKITGANPGDNCGIQARAAGDVNADTIDDLIIGCNFQSMDISGTVLEMVGKVYVLYGTPFGGDINLLNFDGSQGFTITGRDMHARLGTTVAGVGDVNGDGVDDIAITTYQDSAATSSTLNIALCVIFGSNDVLFLSDIYLSQELPPERGMIYIGNDGVYSVSAAGDVNKDGFADIVLGARLASPLGRDNAGLAYVLLGGQRTDVFSTTFFLNDVLNEPSLGFVLMGAHVNDNLGLTVSGGGDINQDGYADVIVSAPLAAVTRNGVVLPFAGVTYVVFGGPSCVSMDLLNFSAGPAGFQILGAGTGDRSGRALSMSGDFNGDGAVDLVVSAVQVGVLVGDAMIYTGPGVVYALNGYQFLAPSPSTVPSRAPLISPSRKPSCNPTTQPTTPTLPPVVTSHKDFLLSNIFTNSPAGRGFHGPTLDSKLGSAVSSGDVNGDGTSDLLFGAPGHLSNRGAVFVVFKIGRAHV